MATLQLGNGDGIFSINGGIFPKGEFYIDKSGPRLSVIATDNMWLRVTGRYNEWIGAEGETFANVDEAGDYIDGLIAKSSGTNVVLTQSQYDALTPPDPDTTYDIIADPE